MLALSQSVMDHNLGPRAEPLLLWQVLLVEIQLSGENLSCWAYMKFGSVTYFDMLWLAVILVWTLYFNPCIADWKEELIEWEVSL